MMHIKFMYVLVMGTYGRCYIIYVYLPMSRKLLYNISFTFIRQEVFTFVLRTVCAKLADMFVMVLIVCCNVM